MSTQTISRKTEQSIDAGKVVFIKQYDRWMIAGPADLMTAHADVVVTKASGETKAVRIESVQLAVLTTASGTEYQIAKFFDIPAERKAPTGYIPTSSRRQYRAAAGDHEDCLSLGGCVHGSPSCPYSFSH